MLARLAEKFAGKLVQAGTVSQEEADVYAFGFYQMLMLLLNVGTTLLLGAAFGLFLPCVLLNVAYIPIRVSAGGHHADTPFRCYLFSTLLIAGLLGILKWVPIPPAVSLGLLAVSGVVIWIMAPVETENHPLDETERHVYRRRAHAVLIAELAAGLLAVILAREQLAAIVVLGLGTECGMLLAGAWKNRRHMQQDAEDEWSGDSGKLQK